MMFDLVIFGITEQILDNLSLKESWLLDESKYLKACISPTYH